MRCSICDSDFVCGTKMADGKICRHCIKKIPQSIRKHIRKTHSRDLKALLEYSDNLRRKNFFATAQLGSMALDEKHGILAISSKHFKDELPEDAILVSVTDLSDVGLDPVNPRYASGAVMVDICFTCSIYDIYTQINQVVKTRVRCKCSKLDANYARWEEPPLLSLFRSMILQAVELKQQEWLARMSAFQSIRKSEDERRAMDMLLLDDGFTLEELKSQKNRMARAFHPDIANVDDKYIKKILNSYNALKSGIQNK